MELTAQKINYLIRAYLKENNYAHTLFVFNHEARIEEMSSNGSLGTSSNALIQLIERGILYTMVETHVSNGEIVSCEVPFDVFSFHKCSQEPLPSVVTAKPHSVEPTCLCWSPKVALASGAVDGTIKLINSSGEQKAAVRCDGAIVSLEWNTEGTLLAVACGDNCARIFSSDGEVQRILEKHTGALQVVRWNRKSNYLVTGSTDMSVIVWDVFSGTARQQFTYHTRSITDAQWKNNLIFASASEDGLVCISKLGSDEPIFVLQHETGVRCLEWDPTRNLLATGCDAGFVRLWKDGTCIITFKDTNTPVTSLKWRNSSTRDQKLPLLFTTSEDGSLFVHSSDSTKALWCVEQSGILCYTQRNDGAFLATGSREGHFIIQDSNNGEVKYVRELNDPIVSMDWSPDGKSIALCLKNGELSLINVENQG